jgi:hypothetical protein
VVAQLKGASEQAPGTNISGPERGVLPFIEPLTTSQGPDLEPHPPSSSPEVRSEPP